MSDENDNQYKGEKTDQSLNAGPKVERGCTDFIFLIIFIAFCVLCLGIAGYAFQHGDPNRLAVPIDPDHKPCGEGDRAGYPLIYFANPTPQTAYQTVCVKKCPKKGDKKLECKTNSIIKSCDQNLTGSQKLIIYDTVEYGGRICMPEVESYLKQLSGALDIDKINNAVNDIRNTWMLISFSAVLAIIMGFVFLRIVRFSAGCIVWSAIFSFIGLFLFAAFKCYLKYLATKGNGSAKSTAKVEGDVTFNSDEWKYLGISFAAIAGIALLVVLCSCRRIRLCIAVVKCSARFLADVSSVIFVPLAFFLLMVIFYFYWIVVSSFLYSSGEISQKPKSLPFGQFTFSEEQKYLGWTHLFELLWMNAFVVASCQFIIIGACAFWYYQRGGGSEVSRAFKLYVSNHIGSVAFGSLIIAIIDLVRLILEFVKEQVKQSGGSENDIVKLTIKCCECYLSCFKRFMEFINKQAYIQIVMTGKSFCPAAKDAFGLVMRNPLRVSILSGFGSLFEFMGNICIMSVTTLICYLVMDHTPYYQERITSPILPCILIAVISFSVGTFFMGLFGTAADCIIILFCMDEEMNTKAKNMPQELQDFMDEHDKDE